MVVVAWVTFICFGFLSFLFINGIVLNKVRLTHFILTTIYILLTAVSAGIIWGGLLKWVIQ